MLSGKRSKIFLLGVVMNDKTKQKIDEAEERVAEAAKRTAEQGKEVLDKAKNGAYDLADKGRHKAENAAKRFNE